MPKALFFSARHRAADGRRARRNNGAKNRFGFYFAILLIVLTANSTLAATVTGLVGYWPFHEGVGTITKDYSGNENGGLLVNGPTWYDGKFGYSLSFNGVDQHVEIPHADSLNTTKELTISAWIYNRILGDGRLPEQEFHIIASKGWAPDAGGSWTLAWDKKSNDLSFCARKASDKGYECVFGDYPMADNDWHHVTGVLSNGKLSLYVDGLLAAKPVALGATSIHSNREDVRIGAVSREANKFLQGWDGLIDEVQVFSRALTESEIKAMFQDAASPQSSEPSPTDPGTMSVTSAASGSRSGKGTVEMPVISPNSGTYSSSVSVTLKSATPGAKIFYTTNGTTPTESDISYLAPFTIGVTSLVKAKAFKKNSNPSSEALASLTINPTPTVATPTINPNGGSYTGSVSVTMATATAGASIRYTTDGTPPTASSALYSAPMTLTNSATVKAAAFMTNYNPSGVASASFTVNPTPTVATPTINPNGGSYTGSVSVTMATATAGASIRYTTDGTPPTASSALYSAPMTLTNSATVKAAAFMTNYNPSGVASASFTVNPTPTVATPTINPNGGSYTGSVSVTMATATAGASIRYTTDGTPPTASSALYSAPMTLTNSATVKAAAFMTNYNPSGVASASFTVNPTPTVATPTINPNGGSYTGSVSVTMATATAGASIRYTTDGTPPTASSALYSAPMTLTNSATVKAAAFMTNYNPSGVASAAFTITQPFDFSLSASNNGSSTVTAGSSIGFLVTATLISGNTQVVTFSASGLPAGATPSFSSPSCTPTCSSTLTINTTAGITPAGTSLITVSAVGVGVTRTTTFNLTVALPTVATPTINPNGGSFTGSASVTMATATAGASIRYTTDGSTPTASSTLYSAPMTLASSATVKAAAFMTNYNPSGVASAMFTVNPTPTVATPTISPNGGSYSGSVSVMLATATVGASIRYTTDGTTPTTSSNLYSAPMTLANSATVKAAAFMTNYNPSGVASAVFTIATSCPAGQFLAEYFNNKTLSGNATFTNCVPSVNFNWGTGGPGNGIGNDLFSARWTGSFNFNAGSYTFTATADDGIRVWVDGTQIINAWIDQAATTYQATVNVTGGTHVIKVEYYENNASAVAQVGWQVYVPPPPPSHLTLIWQDMSTNETGFAIERKVGTAGTYGQIVSVGANTTTYQDTDLVSGSEYCYRVKAFNATQSSAYSNEDCQIAP